MVSRGCDSDIGRAFELARWIRGGGVLQSNGDGGTQGVVWTLLWIWIGRRDVCMLLRGSLR
jgi:hypothetical protein